MPSSARGRARRCCRLGRGHFLMLAMAEPAAAAEWPRADEAAWVGEMGSAVAAATQSRSLARQRRTLRAVAGGSTRRRRKGLGQ